MVLLPGIMFGCLNSLHKRGQDLPRYPKQVRLLTPLLGFTSSLGNILQEGNQQRTAKSNMYNRATCSQHQPEHGALNA